VETASAAKAQALRLQSQTLKAESLKWRARWRYHRGWDNGSKGGNEAIIYNRELERRIERAQLLANESGEQWTEIRNEVNGFKIQNGMHSLNLNS
jgi:hypothetical protein